MIDIVIDVVLFFATAGDDDVDPDVAVAQIETIAHALQNAPESERAAFLERVEERAGEAQGDVRAALEALPGHLGLR